MAGEIVVPDLGESVVEATVGRWLKAEGDPVEVGEPVVSLETDKVDLEVGSEVTGFLKTIEVEEGTDVEVGEVLATIEEDAAAAAEADSPAEPEEATVADSTDEGSPSADGRGRSAQEELGAERATPVAQRIAQQEGVDLEGVKGTGPGGRIQRADVEARLAQERPEDRQRQNGPSKGREGPVERVRMSRRRRTIAQRLVAAQHETAMLTTFNDVDMTAIMDLRSRHKARFEDEHGVPLGITSFFVRAAVAALKRFPRMNAEMDGNELILKKYYDIGVAVGAEEGLVVPVLRRVEDMSFAEIEGEIRRLAAAADEGDLSIEDLRGGTFSITNGGVFGSLLSTPILNPPQVAILGLHRIEERPVAVEGKVVVRPMMYVALSYDHRVVDGREAVQFLRAIKDNVEDPGRMVLHT